MNTLDKLTNAVTVYAELANAKRRNPDKIAAARAELDAALDMLRTEIYAPPPFGESADPNAVPCPRCARTHDTGRLTTGDVLWCQCGTRLAVTHRADRLTRLTIAGSG